jgi:hypothetical protein
MTMNNVQKHSNLFIYHRHNLSAPVVDDNYQPTFRSSEKKCWLMYVWVCVCYSFQHLN